MTEAEWLACDDPGPMLDFLRGRPSERKLRLFACACCRRVWYLLRDKRSRRAVEVAEGYADGQATTEERAAARRAAAQLTLRFTTAAAWYPAAAAYAAEYRAWWAAEGAAEAVSRHAEPKSVGPEHKAQAALLRCIFGNPFRRPRLTPS
jgi:hypothetical protein